VLEHTARVLEGALRAEDAIGRWGGEEFLIVLPGVGGERGRQVAERLRTAVEQIRPASIAITVSIGVSVASGARVEYEPLFKAADEALYRAKRGGRNRVASAATQGSATARVSDGLAELLTVPTIARL
jgi:diguanylate cyclase (GGDEF)-like protein